MKNIYGALGAVALVLGVTPIAIAEPGDEARDYAIDVKGEVLPVSLGELDYPYKAAERGKSGECVISLEVSHAGTAGSYNVKACSDNAFRKAADEFAATLAYPTSSAGQQHELLVSWTTE